MSKVDPVSLNKLDRRSTLLLQAARSKTESLEEKGAIGMEDPGMDALRGSFGTVGSIIRARSARRMSQSSGQTNYRTRPVGAGAPYDRDSAPQPRTGSPGMHSSPLNDQLGGIKRHQLYDAPMPSTGEVNSASSIMGSPAMAKRPTIKFDSQDVVHQYDRPGTGDDRTTEHRRAVGSPMTPGYPPLPMPPTSRTDGLPIINPGRVDLLGTDNDSLPSHDESSMSAGGSGSGLDNGSRQTLLLPTSRFTHDHEVHSAPPTISPRFARPGGGRLHSRDIFDQQSPSTGTLLSFPSVTDSARSDMWDEDEAARERKISDRGRADKRYPRGAGDDDREESVSLWQRSGRDDDDDDNDGTSPLSPVDSAGGIRLVTPQPRVQSRF